MTEKGTGTYLAKVALLFLPAFAAADQTPPETGKPSIGYQSVAEALAALKEKPGASVEVKDGWTLISIGHTLWTFTAEGHEAHPSAVKRELVDRDGAFLLEMSILCEATTEPCDRLAQEFAKLNQRATAEMRQGLAAAAPPNPRDPEVEAFAVHWLDLLEQGEADKAYGFLTDIFKSHVTIERWRELQIETEQRLGPLQSRKLRRIVWYQDPPNAPLPGTYVAVEFDSVYANAPQHFRFVILHAQGDEPFRVMRDESTVGEIPEGGR